METLRQIQLIGQQIKDRREALGMTQAQLAERSGMAQSAVANIESGKKNDIQLSTLTKIAKSLECEPVAWIQPLKTNEEVLDELTTKLAKQILAESSGSTALELQLPNENAIKEEFQRIRNFILHQRKSFLWRAV